MKRFILGLMSFVALGASPLLAQTPTNVQTITHREVGLGCEGGSCPATVCVPECYNKVRKTTVFSSGCEPLCLSYFPFGKLFGHGDCEGGHCEKPITRKYLMMKVVTCEQSATRCVPSQAPGCATGVVQYGNVVVAPTTIPTSAATLGAVTTPAVAADPTPFVGLKMPQAAGTPK